MLVSSIGSRSTVGNTSPIVAVSTFSRSSWPSGWPAFTITTPPGASRSRTELEELARGQVEGDVGLAVGVDRDHVVALVGAAQERPRVLVEQPQPRVVHLEVAPADLRQLRVDLHAVHPCGGKNSS